MPSAPGSDVGALRARQHFTNSGFKFINPGTGNDDGIAPAVCLFRDPQELTAIVFSKLHLKVLSLNLEFLRFDDVVHS